ncbi:hypothetical protein DFJ67_8405 [Asanoa ferruginea]|uniref:Uncharacterized protein n=1 Tax=Asanoa ferruginea TaxID=53367 RepID=A0A3E0A6X6_9ACTN|nr:hypothetical protein DFJ67_8405 [Asanoa ferruginea]
MPKVGRNPSFGFASHRFAADGLTTRRHAPSCSALTIHELPW